MQKDDTTGQQLIHSTKLIVANGLAEECKGLITRKRHTVNNIEISIFDFFIVRKDMVEDKAEMVIDDERKHVLTKLLKTKN